MELTVVGSGTLLPDPLRASTSLHVSAEGHGILLDVGTGSLHGLARLGLDWRALDLILVTHFHTDHVGDLAPLLAAYRYESSAGPLTLCGPAGLEDFLRRTAEVWGDWILDPGRPLSVVELAGAGIWETSDGTVRVRSTPTPHTDESVALRVETGSAALGFTGDTGPSPDLGLFFQGCQAVVAECALSDPPEMDRHLSPQSLAEVAEQARPELLIVSHVYPPATPESRVAEIRKRYDGTVVAARDGLRVRVDPHGCTVDPLPQAP